MRKLFVTGLLGIALGLNALAAEVIIAVGPPAPIVERRLVAPGPRYIWIAGYHRWDGRAYLWVPGRWVLPPREHVAWVAPRYVHRHGGYVFYEGYWK